MRRLLSAASSRLARFAATTLSAAALVASMACPPIAGAQDAEPDAHVSAEAAEDLSVVEARASFEQGRELADRRRFGEAVEAFARSLELVDRPSTAFNLALCLHALGRHVEAIPVIERYRAQADPSVEAEGLADAERMLSHARASVASITLEVLPPEATIVVDGEPLPRPSGEDGGRSAPTVTVNPGTHIVRVEAPDHAPELLELAVRSGQRVRRAVRLASTEIPATLEVAVVGHPSATVTVDGVALAPGARVARLAAGEHRVHVTAEDLVPFERTVRLDWSERLRLDVVPAPVGDDVFGGSALWLGVGAGLVLAALGVLIGVLVLENPPSASGGSTGVVLGPGSNAVVILP